MSYSFIAINKVKSVGTLTSKYNHNCRLVDVSNAIPELYEENEDLIPLKIKDGKQLSYAEAVKERISSLDYYKDKKIRSDAVLAYDIVLTFSKDDGIDIEEWKKRTKDWIEKEFNVAPDGKSNVLHLVFHGDEVGNAHCHALVCPIDEKGHLNARRFTGGSRKMTEIQSSYAKSVESLGLERGVYNSSAHHKTIRKLYAELNNAIKIPDRQKNEELDDYIERVKDSCQTWKAATKKQLDEQYRKKQQQNDIKRNQDRELIRQEAEKTQKIALFNLENMQKKRDEVKRERDAFSKQVDELKEQLARLNKIDSLEDLKAMAAKQKQLESGLEKIRSENQDDAIVYEGHIKYIMNKGFDLGLENNDKEKDIEM